MAVVYDTLVFLAISWRLAKNAHVEVGGIRGGIKMAILGRYLPLFSRSMLIDGQKYYLLTTISALLTIVFASIKSVPVPLSTVFATPTLMLTNIMACRVYRNTRFGLFREDEISTANMSRDIPVFVHQQTCDGSITGKHEIQGFNIDGKSEELSTENRGKKIDSLQIVKGVV
ncbi:hypothetical protein JR316_0011621 [Psilocybe cubensis]|nr:hypothetical protein JR316_0011621 [Psilocybe cubensis]KAH9476051.1 hypothetical protein JR316_0011621 [Psilocybe cubensis]